MKLELQRETKEVEINGETVEVYSRISTARKQAIILTCLKEASLTGSYNKILYETSFYGLVVLSYSNIQQKIDGFDGNQTQLMDLYDEFDSNGIISKVVSTVEEMNKGEITNFLEYATTMYSESKEASESAGYGLSNLIANLSTTFGGIADTLQELQKNDPELIKATEESMKKITGEKEAKATEDASEIQYPSDDDSKEDNLAHKPE